jgi:hypothetical protein
MPNRIIRESCRTSRSLDSISAEAERLFWRLITVADDFGRFKAEPRLVLAACFPRRVESWPVSIVARWLGELAAAKEIVAYRVETELYAYFTNWLKHQTPRAKISKHPAPCETNALAATHDAVPEFTFIDAPTLPGFDLPDVPAARPLRAVHVSAEVWWQEFWAKYPRKTGKIAAHDEFTKLVRTEAVFAQVMDALSWQVDDEAHLKRDEQKHMLHARTWLHQKLFLDDKPGGSKGPRNFDTEGSR